MHGETKTFNTPSNGLVSIDNYDKPAVYIIDIESRPQEDLIPLYKEEIKPSGVLKDPEKIAADIAAKTQGLKKKMSVDTDSADIICIGVKRVGDYDPKLYSPEEMVEFFKENPYLHLVTFNGKGFDLPLLIKVGIKKGLNYPYHELKEMCAKWRGYDHIDLMELICDREFKSLDTLLQIYCGVKKTPINFDTAKEEEIKAHCLEDLKNTELLYEKFKKLI